MNAINRFAAVVALWFAVGIVGAAQAATELSEGVISRSGGGATIVDWAAGTQTSVDSAPATGGNTIYRIGESEYAHVFTSGGTFTAPANEDVTVGYFIVAGGGAGGFGKGSGGGAGGVRFGTFRLAAGESATVTVGAGGVHSTSAAVASGNGGNSSVVAGAINLVAIGGGAGGHQASDGTTSFNMQGSVGGSGGGGPDGKSVDGLQGTAGGTLSSWNVTSGGGGAGCAGATGVVPTNGKDGTAGKGGDGVYCAITGVSVGYAGGGGGGAATVNGAANPGAGGAGGGGRGATTAKADPVKGTDGLGGGGGGGCYNGTGDNAKGWQPGADGGSGVVIFRYGTAPEPEHYWLIGSDGNGASSMDGSNGSGSNYAAGWATSAFSTTKAATSATLGNIYHIGTDNSGVARLLRTPTAPAAYPFLGKEIVMEGGSIAHKGPQNGTVTIPYLTCKSLYTSRISIATGFSANSPGNAFIGSVWTIEEGAVLNTTESSAGSTGVVDHRDIKFSTKIVGAGMIQAAQANANATAADCAIITYDGDLSEFTGKVEGNNTTTANGGLTMRFTKGTALTAGPAAFDAESVAILKGTTLSFGESVVTHPNRGFTFERAVVNVDANKSVTLGGSVTAANGFSLKGAGTLSLAANNSNLAGTVALANGTTLKLAHAGAAGTAMIAGPTTSGQSATVALDLDAIGSSGVSLAALPTGNVAYKVSIASADAGDQLRLFVLPDAVTAPAKSQFAVTVGGENYAIDSVSANDGVIVLKLSGEVPPLELLGGSNNKGDESGKSSMSGEGNPPGWSDGSKAAIAGKDYRVSNANYQLRTPAYGKTPKSYAFAGRRLYYYAGQLAVKIPQGYTLTVPRLIVEENGHCTVGGYWDQSEYAYNLNNDMHLAGDEWQILKGGVLKLDLNVGTETQNGRAYALDAPLTGEGMLVCNCTGTYANHSLRIRLNGDLSGFTGPMVFNGTSGTTFEFIANATAPGAMTATGVGLSITGAVSMVFNCDLTLDATRGVEIAGGCPTLTVAENKTVTVNGAFSAASGFVKKGKGLLILKDTSVAPENIQVFAGIVRLPDGTELGGDTIVELLATDAQGSSSMTGVGTPAGWSNGSLAAEAGVTYRVSGGFQLRSPDYSADRNINQSYTFPGDCLRFANGIVGVKILQNNNLTIPSLFVETNGCCTFSSIWNNNYTGFDANTDTHLGGTTWTVSPGGRLELNASVSNPEQNQRAFALDAPLTGEGTLACTLGGTYEGLSLRVRLNGDLRGLTGPVVLKGTNGTAVVFREGVMGLGAMATAQSDGLAISGPMVVKFVEDFSLDATRGVTATGRPWIWVGKGKTLTVNGAFAAPDGFVAGGPGRIVLKNASTLDTAKILVASGTVVLPNGTELKETSVPTLKENIFTEYVAVNGGRDGVLAAAAAVPALGANDKWGDIDYDYTGNSNWVPYQHITRCCTLAAAAALLGEEDATAQAYLATVVKAMNAWYVKVPTSENWYQAVIAVPLSVAYTTIFAEDYLKANAPTLLAKMVANTETDLNNVNVQTGQNLVWVRGIRAMNGLLNDDASMTRDHVEVLQNEVRVVAFGTEGIQDDWSFHQHGIQPQIANYGRQFLVDNVFWVRAFAGEFCAYPQAKLDILANLATNCFAWSAWNGAMSPDTMGRQIFVSMFSHGASMTNAIMRLLGEVAEPVGYRYFPRSAYAVNRTADWMATVKMGTTQIRSTESGNQENILGKFLGDGAIYTYVTGEEYSDVYALWDDWRMVPGVTQLRGASADWPNPPEVGGNFRTPKATISNDSTKRTVTFNYGPEENLSYQKTWTFVDNGYDVSVAGITATSLPDKCTDVATCVESANAAADAGLVTQNERYSVYHNGEIYYIVWAAPEDITFTLEDRAGNVSAYATCYPREVSGRLFRIVVSHGRNPSGASFKYSVRIGGWDKEDVDPSPRTITVTGNRRVGGQRELTLSFTTPNLHWTNALFAAYGKTDVGDTLSGWDRLEVVANEVLPETSSLVYMANCQPEDKFIRFFFVDPDFNALYQYQTYEAVWSTNGGYIDTGLKFHNGDAAECLFQYKATANAPNHALFGCRVKSGEIVQAVIAGQDIWAHYWDNATTEMHAERNPSTWPNAWMKVHVHAERRWLDRYSTAWNTVKEDNRQYTGDDFTTQTNVWLFAVSGAGCAGYDGNNKPIANGISIRYLRMYDASGALTRDLWAAKRISDGKFGMYDKVENKFYLSANPAGGTFTGTARYQNELLGLDLTKAMIIGDSCRTPTRSGLIIRFNGKSSSDVGG